MSELAIARARDALYALLHDPTARSRLRTHGPAALGLEGENARAFAGIDHDELDETARRIRRDLGARRHRGSAGLVEAFRDTLSGLELDPLLERFIASSHYASYRETAGKAGRGLCVEEAFYRFLGEEGVGEASVRRRELLHAMFRALALQPRPSFAVPSEIRRLPQGGYRFVDVTRAGPVLYAAIRGRLLIGSITPLLARVLAREGVASPADDDVEREAWCACARRLLDMGLLAPAPSRGPAEARASG